MKHDLLAAASTSIAHVTVSGKSFLFSRVKWSRCSAQMHASLLFVPTIIKLSQLATTLVGLSNASYYMYFEVK